MLEAKANYKGYYKQNLKCRLCGLHEETQDHILFECNDNKLEAPNRITKAQIFICSENCTPSFEKLLTLKSDVSF